VAAAGHANPRVVAAGRRQMGALLHAMGDVYPHARKAELARELSRITFERWTASRPKSARRSGKTIFANSGFEAVEAALKTAILATGRRWIVAFTGAYHGLGYGALNVTHREFFRGPFRSQLGGFSSVAPFPKSDADLAAVEKRVRKLFAANPFGAILAEPVQGRGGVNVPPAGFLPLLRKLCDEVGALLILDEIYTGFGRTGKWFACEHSATVPDVICLGKALTGGFPLSACVGRADLMDAAWPRSTGEAIHTSTYLGHPVGCAMALAQIQEIAERRLPERAGALGEFFLRELRAAIPASKYQIEIRGLGLMTGVEMRLPGGPPRLDTAPVQWSDSLAPRSGERVRERGSFSRSGAVSKRVPSGAPATAAALRVVGEMLRAGFIVLPEGEASNIISFTPPLTVTGSQLASAARALGGAVADLPAP